MSTAAHSLLGQVIDREELEARWAYAELRSTRFAASFKTDGTDQIFDKAQSGEPFSNLSQDERADLAGRLRNHHDRSGLAAGLQPFASYKAVEKTRADLLSVICVPGLGWRSLTEVVADPDSGPAKTVAQLPSDTEFDQDEPIIIIPYDKNGKTIQLLLEGTFRSAFFLSRNKPNTIVAWVPAERN